MAVRLATHADPDGPVSDQPVRDELRERAVDGIRALLELVGEDPTREGLLQTPRRVIDALVEVTTPDPKSADLAVVLGVRFEAEVGGESMVMVGPVAFRSSCEHHLAAFTGEAHVAYMPSDRKVVGLSKLGRLVDHFAARLQLQEQLTGQITEALMDYLEPQGAICLIRAAHQCMTCRGVNKRDAVMATTSAAGVFSDVDGGWRREFLTQVALTGSTR